MLSSSLLLLLLLLVLSAGFSSAETAMFSVEDIRLQTLAKKKHPRAILVKKLRSDPKVLLGTILLGNNAANVTASALATTIVIKHFGQVWIGLATGVLTLIILVFSEFIPKTWDAHNSESAAFFFARPVWILTRICAPVVRLFDSLMSRVLKQGLDFGENKRVGEEEIKTMAQLGAAAGTLEEQEKKMIERVFLFNDITTEDVMTPKEDVEFLNGGWTVAEATPLITSEKFSRYPVFDENDEDEMIGIIHVRDIFEKLAADPQHALTQLKIKDLATDAMFIPESKPIDDLFHDFQKEHMHMALVVNEYGSMVGLVTIDDLLEELVGEIGDETDVEDDVIKRVDKYNVLVHGDEEIKDINEFFNIKLPGRRNKTISKMMLDLLGSVPNVGQSVALTETVTATVERMDKLRILRVRLNKKPEEEGQHKET
ncbi:hemolysin family protein [Patescibacteria group bacterium]|nr:hemolysin family protein [Patescibacteria group bacterium]